MSNRTHPYLALLRGINVGGRNIISKEDLKTCFENLEFSNVKTYIQSGNIIFRSASSKTRELAQQIESALKKHYGIVAAALVVARQRYRQAVATAPKDWGQSDSYRHDALFVLPGFKAPDIIKSLVPPKKEIETVSVGPGVIFWSVEKKNVTKATLMKLASTPEYRKVTVRNHNTVNKLNNLLDEL